ncbi:helix-turn-helix domain-containing protein [Rhizobium leguminosarum]|uniref:helix-turn-helix domain-containing protein n=1 Tax=Rhizobium leguminosarum TaxID=384 RepID=UPI0014418D66|nr:helix-turn-helix transcriptional regulator [Rhizobium leguminosarum]NKL56888.1 helix-turn-helix domain-containing protein [Rhizobium leguminosarum bv. viciae]
MLSRHLEGKRGKPNFVDVEVGRRIRMRRVWMDKSQQALGEAIGVTFQQVQKYEKGINRVGASRLQQIATALQVQPSYFFYDMPSEASVNCECHDGAKSEISPEIPELLEFIASKHGPALIRDFNRIADDKVRTKIVSLVKALAGQEQP